MPWSSAHIAGCSGCFDVIPHSKLQGAPPSSEESGRTSPVLTDPVVFSPRPQQHNRRRYFALALLGPWLCWVHDSAGSWLCWVMALLGHGSARSWLCWVMALLDSGSARLWLCWLMALLGHGSAGLWLSWVMALLDSGSAGSWLCWVMALLDSGSAGSWLCWTLALLGHGSAGLWLCWVMALLDSGSAGSWLCWTLALLGWPGTSNSVDICEGLEDWTTDLSFISDSEEEEDDALLVPGRYHAILDHLKCGKDDLVIKHGDAIHVLQEDAAGLWQVKNLTRGGEGRLPVDTLLRILGNVDRSHVIRPGGEFMHPPTAVENHHYRNQSDVLSQASLFISEEADGKPQVLIWIFPGGFVLLLHRTAQPSSSTT
ncbi:hypothetical protein NFI96_004382 [Prochilodus magdalenae]|nr:hypothetical protein NFI96_004382 [Prochilodus magdalenae]